MRASTGNDLVFLPVTRPERTCLPRFYSRILTPAEVEGFQPLAPSGLPFDPGLPFDHYVWLCWSVKESVYKYQKRLIPELSFAPLKIEVRHIKPPAGDREYYAGIVDNLYCRTWVRDNVISTVVSEDQQFTDTRWGFSSIDSPAYADQSAAVRTLALGELRAVFSCDDLRLEKDAAGCPVVLAGDQPLTIPVSLAHHGSYIAYSFCSKAV